MLKIVEEYLNENNWQFSQTEDSSLFMFGISVENGNFQCYLEVDTEDKNFLFCSICGSNVPIGKRSEILDLINRINYKLLIGNFEMDSEDGEIRYRTGIRYDFFEPTKDLVEQLVMANVLTMDAYFEAFMGVIYGDLDPTNALKKIEMTI
jgi:hypothetical protein